jgi:hypothetical protein
MAKPKGKKKGYQAASGGFDGAPIGAALTAGAMVMIVLAIFAMSLKSQLIKPGRIVAAAEKSGLFDKLPRLMYGSVFGGTGINPQKQLMLTEAQVKELSVEMFDPGWVAGEFEQIIYDAADAIKDGQPIVAELYLEDAKSDIASALIAVVKKHGDKISKCGGGMKAGKSLCLPKGVSASLFMNQAAPEIRKVIQKLPNRYPLLPRESAGQIADATGIFGTLSTLGIVFLVIAVAMGGGAWKTHDPDGLSPVIAAAGGFAIGGAILLVLVLVVRGGISAATGALAQALEPEYADVVDKFFSTIISGGFRFALILAVVSLVGGGGLAFYLNQNS